MHEGPEHKLAGGVEDAAWSSPDQKLAYTAEGAGKLFVKVDAGERAGSVRPIVERYLERFLQEFATAAVIIRAVGTMPLPPCSLIEENGGRSERS